MRLASPLLALLLPILLLSCDDGSRPPGDLGLAEAGFRLDAGGPVGDGQLPPDFGNLHPDGPPIDPQKDSDGDGLPDGFETAFGLDPSKTDSDGDSTPDNLEDEDGDSLTAAQEWAAWQLGALESRKPSPRHRDLLVEVDYQQGKAPSSFVLAKAIEAFAALDLPNLDAAPGIALHLYLDEKDLPLTPLGEPLAERLSYLGAHGPKLSSPVTAEMVHVIFASARPGSPSRGGDTVASSSESPEKAGVLVYVDNLAQIFPLCGTPTAPKISLEQGIVSTFVHELGHTLQLGHDTGVGGGVNAYNIMSTDLGECELLRRRVLGTGNSDPALGATEAGGGPRFSAAAAGLIKLQGKISVEANKFEVGEGYEM